MKIEDGKEGGCPALSVLVVTHYTHFIKMQRRDK